MGIPLIALGTFTLLYVLQPLRLIATDTMEQYLTNWQASKAILIAALMLVFFMFGWISDHKGRSHPSRTMWNRRLLWNIGAWAAFIGLALHIVFLERSGGIIYAFSKQHGTAMAWEENTAYLYDSLWWILSGSVMMILGVEPLRTSKWRRRLPVAFALIFVLYALLIAGRGPLFSAAGALFVSLTIAHRQTIPLKKAIGLLAIVGCCTLLVFGYRSVLYLGDKDATKTPTLNGAITSLTDVEGWNQAHGTTGSEFLYHAGAIDTVDQSGKLDYGISWIYYVILNPIPKLLWPEKHYPESPGITTSDITSYVGFPIAGGAASGLVADVYIRYGYFSVLFMLGLGKILRRMHESAIKLESPLSVCAYVMLYSLSLNLFAQDVRAILVAFPYSMLPVLLYTVLVRLSRPNGSPNKVSHDVSRMGYMKSFN